MRTSNKNPIHLSKPEYDPTIVHIYYHALAFYNKEKERLVKHIFNNTKYKDVTTIVHLLEHPSSVIGFSNREDTT